MSMLEMLQMLLARADESERSRDRKCERKIRNNKREKIAFRCSRAQATFATFSQVIPLVSHLQQVMR